MSSTMKAIVYYASGDIRIERISVPKYEKDEMRVKVDACAVCGSDLKAYMYGNPRIKAPLVMGHEFTGTIDGLGDRIEGFSIGDRIVMPTVISCGECYYCKRNWQNLCINPDYIGFSLSGGRSAPGSW